MPCWCAAGSTGSPTSTGHRRTTAPLRARLPRLADPRRCHQVRQHSRRRRTPVPDPAAGQAQRSSHRPAHRRTRKVLPPRDRDRVRAHRDRRPLPRRLRRDPHRREGRHRDRCASSVPWRGSPTTASLSNEFCPTTAAATDPTHGATRAPTWRSPRNAPGPTGPRPTARSSASTAPWATAGPTPGSTPRTEQRNAALPGWLHFYNHHRVHSAIGAKPPISRLTNVPGHHT